MKQLFEPECGTASALSTLSKNYGNNNTKIQSGTLKELQTSIPGISNHDLLANEYLAKICSQVSLPNTFNMGKLLESMPNQNTRQILDNGWKIAQKSSASAYKWSEEFSNRTKDTSVNQHPQWASEFSLSRQDNLNSAWNEATKTDNRLPSISASEYLDKFDIGITQGSNSNVADSWTNEFLNQGSAFDENNQYIHDMVDSNYADYEQEWNDIENGQISNEYTFNSLNQFKEDENPLAKAEQMFLMGNLTDSILYYEAALMKNPQDAEAWCSLGLCLAENEQDIQALSAFQNATKYGAPSRKTILAQSVSLANEGMDSLAFLELSKWIALYRNESIESQQSASNIFIDNNWIAQLENKFMDAVRLSATPNLELQNALAILYNLSKNYEKAIDAITIAISLSPNDAVLWNRLGASLANSERSAEAISAYKKALELFPSYVRARYNLGVSCMNLNSYRDAIGHFLSALKLQKSPETSQIWSKEEEYEKHIVDKIDNINSITRIGTEDVQEHIQHVMQEISAEENKDLSPPTNDRTDNFLFHEQKELKTTPSPTIATALKHEEKKIHSIAKHIFTSHAHPTIAAANVTTKRWAKEMSEEKEISTKYEEPRGAQTGINCKPSSFADYKHVTRCKILTTKATYEQEKEAGTNRNGSSKDGSKLDRTTTPNLQKSISTQLYRDICKYTSNALATFLKQED
uniref:Peroxisomal targeting signal 1 receptor n=1 Tax=Ditylenchus dipsaci TaxID=166011 RepID=A0A915DXP1_9BILA